MKYNYDEISNSQLSTVIDEWVHGERDRAIMKRRLIDCICFEPLAEEFQMSDRHIKRIVLKNEDIIFRHLDVPKTGNKKAEQSEIENVPERSFIAPGFYCQTS